MKTGYIKIDRKLFNNKEYSTGRFDQFHAWIDLIYLAAFDDTEIFKNGETLIVKRGQLITSHSFLSRRWQWSRPTVIKFLNHLQNALQSIEQQKIGVNTLISIVNYEKYQGCEQELLQLPLQPLQNSLHFFLQDFLHDKKTLKDNNNIISYNKVNKLTCVESARTREKDIKTTKKTKKSKEDRKVDFYQTIVPFVEKYGSSMCRSFYDYWTQDSNTAPTKMLFECQKGWSLSYRLATWHRKDTNREKPKDNEPQQIKW